jgi:hypothetical protein
MVKQTRQLSQLLEMTQQMLELAEQKKWSTLAKMQVVRLKLMEQTFPLDETVDTVFARENLLKVIELNNVLQQHCVGTQQALQLELKGLMQGRQASAAYQSV